MVKYITKEETEALCNFRGNLQDWNYDKRAKKRNIVMNILQSVDQNKNKKKEAYLAALLSKHKQMHK